MTKQLTTLSLSTLALVTGASLVVAPSASSASSDHGPKVEQKVLQPSSRYSGNSAVDLSNGLPFNNGTFGLPNAEYESWAQAGVVVPGVSEKTYSYGEKEDFVRGFAESIFFVETALANWEQTSSETKPEAADYSKKAIETMKPSLERSREALSKAKGAGKGDWEKAQSDARQALVDLRGTYSQIHNNVRR